MAAAAPSSASIASSTPTAGPPWAPSSPTCWR
uniref:Uncharacterized protein n=1 Tax=Arundo donax TaxID=35708 RepID=A0A0A9E1H2_ARUDO